MIDDSYLKYPKRAYGQDHDFYDWRQAKDRPHLTWGGDTKLAVTLLVPIEFFPLNPSGKPFKHPGAMVTPYPDLRHYTVRDYGNRVGVYRILEALSDAGLKATFAINGAVASSCKPLVAHVAKGRHEIAAHGLSTDHIHHEGMTEEQEFDLISKTLSCFDMRPTGWMSPARHQSSRTLDCLASQGVEYCLDWEMDSVPVRVKPKQGGITLIPNSYELSDFTLLHTRKQTEESWLAQLKEACDYLISEHTRFGLQSLGITLTPYIMGQPFRIWALVEFLAYLNNHKDISVVTGAELTQQFAKKL